MTKAIDYRAELSTLQASRRMGPDLLSAELGTTRELLRWWQLGSAPETDKQARALADLETSVRRYLQSAEATRPVTRRLEFTGTKRPPITYEPTAAQLQRVAVKHERFMMGKRLLCVLRGRGLRNADVARALGVSEPTIANWKKLSPPSAESLDKLALMIEVTATMQLKCKRGRYGEHPMIGEIRQAMGADRPISITEAVARVKQVAMEYEMAS